MDNFSFLKRCKILDLTYTINPTIPTWNGSCGFNHKIHLDYEDGCRVMSYKLHAGIGTHMDAPSHFYKERCSIHELPLETFFAPIRKITVTDQSKKNPDFLISVEDLEAHEHTFGKIPPKSFVVGYTGWGEFWHDEKLYRRPDAEGRMHFPGFSKEAASFLLSRDIIGIGIDTLSPETGKDGFPVHELILGAGLYILENMASLQDLPNEGAFLLVLPLKIEGGAEAPVRAVALIPPPQPLA